MYLGSRPLGGDHHPAIILYMVIDLLHGYVGGVHCLSINFIYPQVVSLHDFIYAARLVFTSVLLGLVY
jgi:hypothetical protein